LADPVTDPARSCPSCGTEVAPLALACPVCRALIHAKALKELSAQAATAEAAGKAAEALSAWQRAIALLPPDSRQYAIVTSTIERLEAQAGPAAAPAPPRPDWTKRSGALGALALLLWKMKFLVGLVLAQGKLILLGFTKTGTLLSMLAFFGVYWKVHGWPYAAGLVISIYLHEMGHVASLRRHGIPASPPMFLPGIGAVVRLKARQPDPHVDAQIGLAGPVWGLAAALAAWAVGAATSSALLTAVAHSGAQINLFNLIPLGPLDGGRGIRPLSDVQRWILFLAVFGTWSLTEEHWLLPIAGLTILRAFRGGGPPVEGDRRALVTFAVVASALAVVSHATLDAG
jgi:Zn-dependent protease